MKNIIKLILAMTFALTISLITTKNVEATTNDNILHSANMIWYYPRSSHGFGEAYKLTKAVVIPKDSTKEVSQNIMKDMLSNYSRNEINKSKVDILDPAKYIDANIETIIVFKNNNKDRLYERAVTNCISRFNNNSEEIENLGIIVSGYAYAQITKAEQKALKEKLTKTKINEKKVFASIKTANQKTYSEYKKAEKIKKTNEKKNKKKEVKNARWIVFFLGVIFLGIAIGTKGFKNN